MQVSEAPLTQKPALVPVPPAEKVVAKVAEAPPKVDEIYAVLSPTALLQGESEDSASTVEAEPVAAAPITSSYLTVFDQAQGRTLPPFPRRAEAPASAVAAGPQRIGEVIASSSAPKESPPQPPAPTQQVGSRPNIPALRLPPREQESPSQPPVPTQQVGSKPSIPALRLPSREQEAADPGLAPPPAPRRPETKPALSPIPEAGAAPKVPPLKLPPRDQGAAVGLPLATARGVASDHEAPPLAPRGPREPPAAGAVTRDFVLRDLETAEQLSYGAAFHERAGAVNGVVDLDNEQMRAFLLQETHLSEEDLELALLKAAESHHDFKLDLEGFLKVLREHVFNEDHAEEYYPEPQPVKAVEVVKAGSCCGCGGRPPPPPPPPPSKGASVEACRQRMRSLFPDIPKPTLEPVVDATFKGVRDGISRDQWLKYVNRASRMIRLLYFLGLGSAAGTGLQ